MLFDNSYTSAIYCSCIQTSKILLSLINKINYIDGTYSALIRLYFLHKCYNTNANFKNLDQISMTVRELHFWNSVKLITLENGFQLQIIYKRIHSAHNIQLFRNAFIIILTFIVGVLLVSSYHFWNQNHISKNEITIHNSTIHGRVVPQFPYEQ